jgi:uncharacterized membrane protein YdjX (TVP38/TMEM64 family)
MRRATQLKALLTTQNLVALVVLLVCLGLGWWLLATNGLDRSSPTHWVTVIHTMGWGGVLLFIGASALAVVVSPIPGTPLTMTAGAVWGVVPAAVYAIIGISLGSLLAYFIGRTLGRSTIQALTGKTIYLSKHKGEIYLGWVMFVTHLFPVLPFDLISYGAGISGLSLPIYATATILGTIPGTLLLTYIGFSLRSTLPIGIGLLVAFFLLAAIALWGVKSHNWLGLKDIIKLQSIDNCR